MEGNAMGNSPSKIKVQSQVFKSNKKFSLSKQISLKESRWLDNVTRGLPKIARKIPKIAEIKRCFA